MSSPPTCVADPSSIPQGMRLIKTAVKLIKADSSVHDANNNKKRIEILICRILFGTFAYRYWIESQWSTNGRSRIKDQRLCVFHVFLKCAVNEALKDISTYISSFAIHHVLIGLCVSLERHSVYVCECGSNVRWGRRVPRIREQLSAASFCLSTFYSFSLIRLKRECARWKDAVFCVVSFKAV